MSDTTLEHFTATFATTERLSPGDMARYRGRALERLARHARAQVPFYRARLDALFDSADRFVPEAWREVPIFTRPQAQQQVDALRAARVPEQAGATVEGQTSGSTGMSFHHARSALADLASNAMTTRLHRWHGLDFDKRLARITIDWSGRAVLPDGLCGGPWSREGTGEGWHLGIEGSDAAQQAAWLRRVAPSYLLSYPTAALAILRAAAEQGPPLPLEAVLTTGEVIGDDTRREIAGLSGGRVVDAYGTQELGQIAGQCPQAPHYHVCAESQFVEIVDAAGDPVPAGAPGRLVVTSFYNFAMPFIRYDTGDLATAGAASCVCGRTLPTIARILGRQRHMFTFPGGRSIWPQASSVEMLRHVPSRQFQIAQTAPLAVEYRYVPQQPGQSEDRAALAAYLRRQFDPRIDVSFRPCETIARLPGGKYQEYVRDF
ncbi:phenylacetate--CoA ligase family protein [Breoghania sp. L-A4]|uniref:phenylacetate--CoA ligase family protein n=1 Tax=Breoghania sp. L-A4 TaxID=2304600 RepID=UPI000E35A0AF|nr:phenylacetate--CoA ligase family protein [Breoghania sp. L-A4]AXS42049.1 phenylacetate--CoA ligase family protein [Breoghania sp. L-A4]